MTDYTKLIERMRTDSAFDFTTLGNEAADAIEALQKEVSALDVLLEECKMDWSGDVTQLKAEHKHEIEALQAECAEHKENAMRNARVAVSIRAERDQLQAENDLLKGYRDRALELATAYNNAQENIEQINAHREHILAVNEKLTAQVDAMGKGEPVAHVYAIERTGRPLVAWDDAKGIGLGDKLYAAPKALAPLTDEQIDRAALEQVGFDGCGTQPMNTTDIRRIVRAAHGIGGTQ